MAVLWNYSVSGFPLDIISDGKGNTYFYYGSNATSHYYLQAINESNGSIKWNIDLGTSPIISGLDLKLDFDAVGNLLFSFNGYVKTYATSDGQVFGQSNSIYEIANGNYVLSDSGLVQRFAVATTTLPNFSSINIPSDTGRILLNDGSTTRIKNVTTFSGTSSTVYSLYDDDIYKNTSGDLVIHTKPAYGQDYNVA